MNISGRTFRVVGLYTAGDLLVRHRAVRVTLTGEHDERMEVVVPVAEMPALGAEFTVTLEADVWEAERWTMRGE